MFTRDEILEYPYNGVVKRIEVGLGDEDDIETIIYEGVMDEHMTTDDEGRMLQTSSYIISMPLTKMLIPHPSHHIQPHPYQAYSRR